jgi:hypothetical protein
MGKKGNLLTWGVFSLLMGAVLFLMLSRVGLLFGDSTQRHDEYIVKDTAILATMLHGLPGNVLIHTNYPVYDKIIEISNERVSIYPPEDEALKGQYTYRTIGYDGAESIILEQQESLDIAKDTYLRVNVEPNLNAQECQTPIGDISNIQFIADENGLQLAQSMHALLTPIVDTFSVKSLSTYLSNPLEVDLSLIVKKEERDSIKVYTTYTNTTIQGIACRLSNEFSRSSEIQSHFMVEDALFSERVYPRETMIYLLIPEDMSTALLTKTVYDVITTVVE